MAAPAELEEMVSKIRTMVRDVDEQAEAVSRFAYRSLEDLQVAAAKLDQYCRDRIEEINHLYG